MNFFTLNASEQNAQGVVPQQLGAPMVQQHVPTPQSPDSLDLRDFDRF